MLLSSSIYLSVPLHLNISIACSLLTLINYYMEKVENQVVGAPCGVMDQMASACGEANKLLAMLCQV